MYRTLKVGSVENNSKIECRNFRNIIFFKKEFSTMEKINIGEYSKNKHLPNFIFPKELIIRQMGADPALLIRYWQVSIQPCKNIGK
jgi:hypothetical protein